jgi:predicted ATPase/DNA-binding winged helix-turn-helix (wHTH) protein
VAARTARVLGHGSEKPPNSAKTAVGVRGRRIFSKNLKFHQALRIIANMVAGADLPASVEFGRFRVLPHRREMIADGTPIKLGGRAFDILMTLIEARGGVVTKDALIAQVWPGRVVEEHNLQSHISALRAALGPERDLIRTVSGRGYQFVGELRALSQGGDQHLSFGPPVAEPRTLPPTNVPEPVSELIGRDDELAEIINLMGAHRLVTLTGTGGIGKTRLAVAVAHALRSQFADGVWLAQFSPLADPRLVPTAVAAAVGFAPGRETSVASVAQALAGRRLLLVLDTCEHVIEIAASLWMRLSLLEECRDRVERALVALAAGAERDARYEMKLHAALGGSLIHTGGTVAEIGVAWTRALELAESLDDSEYQLRSLLGLCFFQTASSGHRAAMALAQRFRTLAEKKPEQNNLLIGDRLIGVSQHYLGDQSGARHHLEYMLAHYDPAAERSHIVSFPLDERVMARTILARVLWLQGFPDQAMRAAETSIADARAANHLNSLCYALSQGACPIALLAGDLEAAESYVEMLLDEATKRAAALWRAWGHCYRGTLIIRGGDVVTGLRLLRDGYSELGGARFAGERLIAVQMAEAAGRAGQITEGLVVIERAIDRSERTEERWQIPELLRVEGELLTLQDAGGAMPAAEDHFRQALDWARRQGALSWELRAATSLARLWRGQGRSGEALALLQPVYDRFTEGFDTADLKEAKLLLDAL